MDITEKERIDEQGNKPKDGLSQEQFCIVYAVCHVMGMLSDCANPVIYGYLNENFNREFKEIFAACFKTPCAIYREWRKKSKGGGNATDGADRNGAAGGGGGNARAQAKVVVVTPDQEASEKKEKNGAKIALARNSNGKADKNGFEMKQFGNGSKHECKTAENVDLEANREEEAESLLPKEC